ncbi:MAG: carotenoid biosynthesis protein [Verrucomicrobiota bacterium]
MFRRVFHLLLAWYAIWFLVGLVVLAIPYESPVGNFEDLLFMVLAASVIFLDATRRIGWAKTLAAFLWVAVASGAVELLGALTGFPFGTYHYTEKFGPQIAGILPWAIPLAWWVVVYPLYLLIGTVAQGRRGSSFLIVLGVGLAATAIDFALEPVATQVRGYWLWESGGAYYGVPWRNFVAWFAVAVMIAGVIHYFGGRSILEGYHAAGSLFLPLSVIASVLLSFLGAGLVNGLWLASFWTTFLVMVFGVLIVRFAWPRREVFLLEQIGRYR